MKYNKNVKNYVKTVLFLIMFVLIYFLSINQTFAGNTSEQLEWKVSVGDSKAFKVTKFHDPKDSDGDGNPDTVTTTVIDANNESVELVLRKGSEFLVRVVALNDSALIQINYNGNVTEKAKQDSGMGFLQKTVSDKTYWEKIAKDSPECSIKGDLFKYTQKTEDRTSINKYNMTSGWLEYSSLTIGDASQEISASTYETEFVPLDFLAFFFGLFLTIKVVRVRRTQRIK